jgi:glycosyltransferase involved in cell wall biosynthesis
MAPRTLPNRAGRHLRVSGTGKSTRALITLTFEPWSGVERFEAILRSMKVTIVTWRFPEETEPQVIDQLVRMLDRGIECEVIANELLHHTRIPKALDGRVVIRAAGAPPHWTRRREPPLLASAADVVYFQHVGLALHHRRWLAELEARTVVGCRGSDVRVGSIESPSVADRLRFVFGSVDRIHCVSEELAIHCASFGARPDQLFIAPTGVNLDIFARATIPARPDGLSLRIVSVGRLHWVKGFEYGVQAVQLLRERGHRVNYTIVGPDQGAAEAIRLAVRDLELQDVVTLAGQLPPRGVRDTIAGSDVFLLPSLSEGAPVAVMESMAMGVPVVVTAVGGTPEIVVDGTHGYVVPSRDPAAMAIALEKLIPSASRERMGAAAAEHARRNFDRASQIDRLIDVFEALAAPTRSRRRMPVSEGSPILSVVIPARNAGATIDDQLRALSFQRYAGSWEVVVVDDGSADDTRRRALAWQDRLPGLQVLDSPGPPSIGQARNLGVRAAVGALIVMCDADDVVAPGWLAAHARALQDTHLVCGALERSLLAPRGSGQRSDTAPALDVRNRIRITTGNCGFHREVFDRVGGFDAALRRGSDLDFGWRALAAGFEPRFVADAVVHFRPRRHLAGVARQAFADGQCWPALYLRHRDRGLEPRSPRAAIATYRDLARGPASSTWADHGPSGWIYSVAWSAGRVVGSLRHRVVFL